MRQKSSETSIQALQKAILELHGCKAIRIKSVSVKELFEGETAWEGIVQVFKVDHPKSKLCYAWSHELEDSKKRKFFAVLHQGPVDSPQAPVRASILSNFKSKRTPTK